MKEALVRFMLLCGRILLLPSRSFVQTDKQEEEEQLVKEIRIFSKLSHDNIVKMFGVVVDAENIGIIMEYLPKTLYHAIFIEEVSFGREEKKRIIGEIIAALCYLHTPEDTLSYSKPKIAHCDVKSQNILLDVNNVAKLCDFGLSAMKNTMQSSSSRSLAVPGQGTLAMQHQRFFVEKSSLCPAS